MHFCITHRPTLCPNMKGKLIYACIYTQLQSDVNFNCVSYVCLHIVVYIFIFSLFAVK